MNNQIKPAGSVRVRIAMIYPLSITFGGFEHQAIQTCRALQSLGVDAQLLDWARVDDEFDILHFFGAASGWYDLGLAAAKKHHIVITALGAPKYWKQPIFKWTGRLAAFAGRLICQQTDYARVRELMRCADGVICLNSFHRQFYQFAYDLPLRKLTVVSNGVPGSRYKAKASIFTNRYGIRDYVLFTGNIVQRKRPLQLARVLKHYGLAGVFIGSSLNSKNEFAYALEFEEVVKNTPNLLWIKGLAYDDPLLDSAYAGACVFCLPSVAESQPLSAMEAMAAGVPVILADLPYAYQAPFKQVVRCNPDDDRSLGHALKMVLKAPDQYRSLLPETYSWANVAGATLKIYQRIMESKI